MSGISIDKLRPHPSNNLFFDDLTGADWEAFLNDIQEKGIREPLRITTDFQVICGHQRLRAAKELGMQTVPVIIEDIQNVEDVERLLVEDNLHRRHLTPTQKAKLAKQLMERWGIKHGGSRRQNGDLKNSSDVAEFIGESERTMQRLLKLNDLVPELKELVDSKKLGKVFAEKLASFTPDEQKFLYKLFGDDIGKAAKAEAEQYIQETLEYEKDQIKKQYKDAIPRDMIPEIEAAAIERHQEETSLLLEQKDIERDRLIRSKERELKQQFEAERKNDEFIIQNLRAGLEKAKEELKTLKLSNPDDYDEKAAELQKKKLQDEADINTIQLRIAYKDFINKAAVSAFLAGAIATANPGERQRFKELVEMAEGIIQQTKIALNGRKVVENNE